MDDLLVIWTARLAVAAYVARLVFDVGRSIRLPSRAVDGYAPERDGSAEFPRRVCGLSERAVLRIWTLGCGFHLLHVVCAFHFAHHWSHQAAYEQTAQQTAAVTGWLWGGGLWINYAFTLWWPLDVWWCWRRGPARTSRRYVMTVHAIVGFIMFNATVVFGPVEWIPVVLIVVVTIILVRRTDRTEPPSTRDC